MPQLQQFRLPDVGEGLTEADILRWDVAVGDTVTVNQVIVEVETAKAAVELPSPYAGVVQALHVEEGATVEVGTPIITIDTGGEATGPVPGDDISVQAAAGHGARVVDDAGKREPNLVGYGPGHRGSRRRAAAAVAPVATAPVATAPVTTAPVTTAPVATAPVVTVPVVTAPVAPAPAPSVLPPGGDTNGSGSVLAKPPVRQLAKALGVDLTTVTPTGPHGTVTRADVEAAVSAPAPQAAAPVVTSGAREERIPVRGVRKHTAAAMVSSAFTAPHVSEFVTVDITATMELRDRVAGRPEFRDVKLSPLVFVARALLLAVRRTPEVNASWVEDADGATIVRKHVVNLGIAAATERGLVVPNIPDAHTLSLRELAGAIADLTAVARAGRTTPASLSGGTITITNIGVFGIDAGTPILNPGEAAILAVGAVRRAPWVVVRDGVETIEPRWVTQLALSFDHRLVDGAEGSRFLADIAAVLHDPGLAVL
ncbi:dihydrolipoamide acetyltransferase family protein [Jatrophihabitans sp. YIM 134969]